MAPMLDVLNENDYNNLIKLADAVGIKYSLSNKKEEKVNSFKDNSDFIYVPSINLYVAKQRTHLGKNWFDCHKELQSNNQRMLIIPE
ncbi:MAG: hypothetical protein AABY06_04040, partial [Nanoarchaeota archaeon]